MEKVNLDVVKPWVQKRITELLGGIEDEVLIEYIFQLLETSRVNQSLFFFCSHPYLLSFLHLSNSFSLILLKVVGKPYNEAGSIS